MVEKPKEEEKEGIKLKPVPPKEKEEPEKKEGVKLKPVPQKEKEEVKKPAPKGMAPQKVKTAKEEISEETETVQETRKVSFKQEEIHVSSASSEMTSATKTIQETQVQEQVEQQGLDQAQEISEGDAFYALATFVSETGEAMNLVEGERVYVLEWNNADWWYVRKHLTEETGWVPAQYLKDEETYTMYVQRKLVEKIEKLPVFEKPKDNENAC
ncbi:MAG: hypothetical protein CMJ52_02205, partial [Planctomycetaceae bacterium]|nr:hypothetical protein [Planctomycetaceae bacterium]